MMDFSHSGMSSGSMNALPPARNSTPERVDMDVAFALIPKYDVIPRSFVNGEGWVKRKEDEKERRGEGGGGGRNSVSPSQRILRNFVSVRGPSPSWSLARTR